MWTVLEKAVDAFRHGFLGGDAAENGASRKVSSPLITAKMKDGSVAKIEFEDQGDRRPLIDEIGNYYEGWTSRFVVNGKEAYSRVDKALMVDQYSAVERQRKDFAMLDAMGVDISTIEIG